MVAQSGPATTCGGGQSALHVVAQPAAATGRRLPLARQRQPELVKLLWCDLSEASASSGAAAIRLKNVTLGADGAGLAALPHPAGERTPPPGDINGRLPGCLQSTPKGAHLIANFCGVSQKQDTAFHANSWWPWVAVLWRFLRPCFVCQKSVIAPRLVTSTTFIHGIRHNASIENNQTTLPLRITRQRFH